MKWRQFFTPVQSMDIEQARALMATSPPEEITILDVRQPGEYQQRHIPGARLIPLTDLSDRIGEINPHKPTIVYCAVGGRSRIAAQILSGNGFETIYNLSGGIKAWNGQAAIGGHDQGMAVFAGRLSPKESLVVAYSMEQGLRDFYLSIMAKVGQESVLALFQKLADIEIHHQQRIFAEYRRTLDPQATVEAFEAETLPDMIEGGLTTQEYLDLYQPDLNSATEVISMAMSIEAQAMDLYQRAAQTAQDPESRKGLLTIAAEEQAHLNELGQLMDRL